MKKQLARRTARTNQYVFSVQEVARRLRVSDQHIINLIEGGTIEAMDVSGRGSRSVWRIPRESFERYKSRNSSMTTGGGKK